MHRSQEVAGVIASNGPDRESIIEIADEVREGVGRWLERMARGLKPGHFRFTNRGSLVPASGRRGQFVTCFAVKAARHTGIWKSWSDERRQASIRFIQSFQRPDGWFVDEAMLRRAAVGAVIDRVRGSSAQANGRERLIAAETRQSAATLLEVGVTPDYPLPLRYPDAASVRAYIRSLDWTVPWGAGSHTSHTIFFLYVNARRNGIETDERIDAAFEELDALRDPTSGTWFRGVVDGRIRMNGAMKILTAYRWTGRPLAYARELVDTALSERFTESGCSFLNRLFVIQNARVHCPDYRREDIEALALTSLERAMKFRAGDGAFSFYPGRAQRRYLDSYVSFGGSQSDMHGTVMLTWAIALCLDLLGIGEAGWQPSTP